MSLIIGACLLVLFIGISESFTYMTSLRLSLETATDCHVCEDSALGSSGHHADTACNGVLKRCQFGCLTELSCDHSIQGAVVRVTKQCIEPGTDPCPATDEYFPTAWGFLGLHQCVAKECCNTPGCNVNAGNRLQDFLFQFCNGCSACVTNICFNSGSCVSQGGIQQCICPFPYTGKQCEGTVCGTQYEDNLHTLQEAIKESKRHRNTDWMECSVPDTGVDQAKSVSHRPWPSGVIPYVIQPDGYSVEDVAAITAGISQLEMKTMIGGIKCIHFIPRTTETDYVEVYNGNGCFSHVGMIGGRQLMSLNAPGCLRIGTVMHEFLHVLGFYHEHTRMDRDDFVIINWPNVLPGYAINFETRPVTSDESLYTYGSVMHYSPWAFALDDNTPTIWTCDPNAMAVMGQQTHLDHIDIIRVQRLYQCT